MPSSAVDLGEAAESAPAAAWWRGAVWLAYAVNGTLVLWSVDVVGDPSQSVRFATGLPCDVLPRSRRTAGRFTC
jgi:hypothetical protein